MVSIRYPETPYVQDYQMIIAETVKAHFLGLSHIAVSGLMPVIEGVGSRIAKSRGVKWGSITQLFVNLANDCKADAENNNIGAVEEIILMMDSFIDFTKNHLYINSSQYELPDGTNRHGILHGAYSDTDYGVAINFYKAIAAIDFLCFISAFHAPISWFAPSPTDESVAISKYYKMCVAISKIRSVPARQEIT